MHAHANCISHMLEKHTELFNFKSWAIYLEIYVFLSIFQMLAVKLSDSAMQ